MKKVLAAVSFMMMATFAQANPTTIKGCFIHLPSNKTFVNVNQIQRVTYESNTAVTVMLNNLSVTIPSNNTFKTAQDIMAAINKCSY